MTFRVNTEAHYAKMVKGAEDSYVAPPFVPVKVFKSDVKLFDQTNNWNVGIANAKEFNRTVQYITLNRNKVSFNPPIHFDKKKILRVIVSDSKERASILFEITMVGIDGISRKWVVDTDKKIKVPGEIMYDAVRKI